jgi:hypothetical protein
MIFLSYPLPPAIPSFRSFWTRLPAQSSAWARRRCFLRSGMKHAVGTRTLEDWLPFEPWKDTLSLQALPRRDFVDQPTFN